MQHLFMQHPRSVFLIGSLALLLLLLLAFTAYHVYLITINQTTNERFKLSNLQSNSSNNNNADESIPATQHIGSFYSKGLLMNLHEVFFPQLPKGKVAPAKEVVHAPVNGQPVQPKREAPRHRGRRK